MDITKAIVPCAGLGTAFLPFTKTVPKELLPLLNKPAIHYCVEEAVRSTINNLFFVTSGGKAALADYFDASHELKDALRDRNQEAALADIEKIMRLAHFTYVRQSEPLGLGHAVWLARHSIGKEYFGVTLPDDIIINKDPGLAQLIRIARQEKASVVAVQEVPTECVSQYGIIAVKKQITPNLFHVSRLIEKPDQKDAPTNLAIIGRYVLSHKLFKALDDLSTYAVDELHLTDGINHMMKNNEKVFAYKIQGTRYDIGNPIGWVKAVIGLALQDPVYSPHIERFIANLGTVDSFLYDNSKNISHTL